MCGRFPTNARPPRIVRSNGPHAVRGNPRQFVVLPGHVYPEVEFVVEEREAYVVVEKIRAAARVAEQAAT